ncbi:hypothetical protein EEJ42_10490 [Streptomyces botrytidirepellens]|uniref:Uncharacterized protein n=1 Tax=Streptomyces botrytidirepellens TaxID=2486417 RepID=A0A3M8WNB0_9ACTN|nr:hypothetical protein EEJ42_10490 [Streptomyces botrytidirepellens]
MRPRDRWVRVEAALLRRVRDRYLGQATAPEALVCALTGSASIGDQSVEVHPRVSTPLTTEKPPQTRPSEPAGSGRSSPRSNPAAQTAGEEAVFRPCAISRSECLRTNHFTG